MKLQENQFVNENRSVIICTPATDSTLFESGLSLCNHAVKLRNLVVNLCNGHLQLGCSYK